MMEHFDDILKLINHSELGNMVATSYGKEGVVQRGYYTFSLFSVGDKFIVLPPSGPLGRYYRGEDKFYLSCKSSFSRLNEIQKLIFSIKQIEFVNGIKETPEIVFAEEEDHLVDYDALMQHYNLKSQVIDITSDLIVAAFFATNKYDPITNTYIPIGEGVGYIWYYDNFMHNSDSKSKLRLTGLQPFKRPEEQHAFSFHLDDNEDFGAHAFRVSFNQNLKVSEYIHHIFVDESGKNTLFPKEDVAEFADKLITAKSIWINALEKYNKLNNSVYDEKYFKAFGFKLRKHSFYKTIKRKYKEKMAKLKDNPFNKFVTTRLSYRPRSGGK